MLIGSTIRPSKGRYCAGTLPAVAPMVFTEG